MIKFILAGFLAFVLCACHRPGNETDFDRGKALYNAHCASCHGVKGDGKGPMAGFLDPKPRDLTSGVFKFRRSHGALPGDLDILQIMKTGIPGTSMPGWNLLDTKSWQDILAYIKTFSPIFKTEKAGEVIEIPEESPKLPLDEAVKKGRALYEANACAGCHGPEGRADSQTVAGLKDSWGNAVLPRDLTRGPFKWGNADKDVYRTLALGIPGAIMPRFDQKLKPNEIWQLVHYLKSIQKFPKGYEADHQLFEASNPQKSLISVVKVAGAISDNFNDPQWQNLKAVPLFLKPLRHVNRGPEWVMVRALHNDNEIAFDLSWEDEDADPKKSGESAVALQFPLKKISDPSELPYLGMGSPENPVLIWQWKPSGVAEWKGQGAGKLVVRDMSAQHTTGRATYENGVWHVVFKRSLKAKGNGDVSFDKKIGYLSLALWIPNLPDPKNKSLESFSEWNYFEIQ